MYSESQYDCNTAICSKEDGMLTKTQIKETVDNAAKLPLMVALLPGRQVGVRLRVFTGGRRNYELIRDGETVGAFLSKTEAVDGIAWALAALNEDEASFRAEADRLAREKGRRHYVTFCIRNNSLATIPTHSVTHWPSDMRHVVYETEGA
jgi:hypothetical protein